MGRQRNGKPSPKDLTALEKAYRREAERIRRSGSPEWVRAEGMREAREQLRQQWDATDREIREGYEGDIADQRRQANPLPSKEVLARMNELEPLVRTWERSFGKLLRDAEHFEQQGDVGGLELARRNTDLIKNNGVRRSFVEGVGEVLQGFESPEVTQARSRASELEAEANAYELAAGMRRRGMVSALLGTYKRSSQSRASDAPPEPEPVGTGTGADGAGAKGRKR